MTKKVLFVVGASLGHVGRTMVIARALQSHGHVSVFFTGPDRHGFINRLVAEQFPIVDLPCDLSEDHGIRFANSLERVFAKLNPDLICCDLTPIPLLVLVRFPPVPQVYVTNYFLTHLGERPTVQDESFCAMATTWNTLRNKRGLPELTSPRTLYERDAVLLADPPALVSSDVRIPANYHVVGPCIWEPDMELPAEIEPLDDVLYVSLGSTGTTSLPEALLKQLMAIVGASAVVAVHASRMPDAHLPFQYSYNWLPGNQVLKRACFVVTQGGTGSVYQALTHGIPIGCWPSHQNHHVLGEELEKQGLGIVWTPDTWDETMHRLEKEKDILWAHAQDIGQSLQSMNGPGKAAHIIGQMLA